MTYVLPNRKAFSDSITRIFLKYREKAAADQDNANEDLCARQGAKNTRELFSYQKLVRDYLLIETPYRGLLLYHGLGSGKTCSSIAVAESLMNNKRVFILLPASLQENYRQEIRKCGDPVYVLEQHWQEKQVAGADDVEFAKSMGLSDAFLEKYGKYYITASHLEPNFQSLPKLTQDAIRAQIEDLINTRFTFINYNGLSASNADKVLPPDQPHLFDNSVIIIDEAHNLIGNVVNDRAIKRKLYDMMYRAKNTKIVALSGTPIINRPNEIAYLMNLLKGPIERITVPLKTSTAWDEERMTNFFKTIPDVDTIEFNSVKKALILTRTPPHFETQYNEKGERIGVKYNKARPYNPSIRAWVASWKLKYEMAFGGNELTLEEMYTVEDLECLPTKYEEFVALFVDGLSVKNPLMLQRRIQGLVSYYRGADERLIPKRLDEDSTLQKIPMSNAQYLRYLELRWEEIQQESKKGRMRPDLNEEFGSFRMKSRLTCNYAVPTELTKREDDVASEDANVDKSDILEFMKKSPERFLMGEGLARHSPKMAKMLEDIQASIGTAGAFRNQFVYSQYLTLEGLGVFSAILEANGFQEYKLQKTAAGWIEHPDLKPGVPAYAFFSGENKEEREMLRQIFNESYSGTFPQSLKDSIKEKKLCVFMASAAGAEGITLANVRNVSIMEPYWNPARIDQVIGRAIRICSHATLPMEERTVKVRLYMTVFSPDQATTAEGPNIVSIRRNDMVLKRYEGEQPRETFMTSDEFLYEVSFEKSRLIKQISHLLKQSAIDCEIHRKLHSKEQPVIQCMRFDTNATPDELGYKPAVMTEERDSTYTRNIIRKARRLQKVLLKGTLIIYDPDTREIFDAPIFEDSQRLLKIGEIVSPNKVRFFTSTE
jgi:hypothetical protein